MADETQEVAVYEPLLPDTIDEFYPTTSHEGARSIVTSGHPISWALPTPAGWELHPEKMAERTPREEIFVHPKGFLYVKIGYVIRKLNEGCGVGGWKWVDDNIAYEERKMRTRDGLKDVVEVTVEGYLFTPYPNSPVYGIGGGIWQPDSGNNKSAAIASARSVAIKNAAKAYGIGAELNDGSEEGDEQLNTSKKTAETLFKQLVEMGRQDEAIEAVKKLAADALEDGMLTGAKLADKVVDDVREALTDLMINPPEVKPEAKKEGK